MKVKKVLKKVWYQLFPCVEDRDWTQKIFKFLSVDLIPTQGVLSLDWRFYLIIMVLVWIRGFKYIEFKQIKITNQIEIKKEKIPRSVKINIKTNAQTSYFGIITTNQSFQIFILFYLHIGLNP